MIIRHYNICKTVTTNCSEFSESSGQVFEITYLGIAISDRFSIPKSLDYERPNPGISGLENNVLTLLLRVKCMH